MRVTNLLADPAVAGLVVNVHDVTARHQVQADLERQAFTDSLTGLPNRALFHDRLDQLPQPPRPVRTSPSSTATSTASRTSTTTSATPRAIACSR